MATPFTKPGLVCEPVVSVDMSLVVFQVNEIYHDESLGAHINVVLVRIILLSYGKVSGHCRLVPSRLTRHPPPLLWDDWGPPVRQRPPLKAFMLAKTTLPLPRCPLFPIRSKELLSHPYSPFNLTFPLKIEVRVC